MRLENRFADVLARIRAVGRARGGAVRGEPHRGGTTRSYGGGAIREGEPRSCPAAQDRTRPADLISFSSPLCFAAGAEFSRT